MNNELLTLSLADLTSLVESWGFPSFRARQVYEWLHKHHCTTIDAMSNVPKALKSQLSMAFPDESFELVDRQLSQDGTRKYVFRLADGHLVETVGMPIFSDTGSIERLTVCVSSQVGCAMACAFCATGREGFTRNLSAAEIVQQVSAVQKDFDHRVSNVVVMGQGEPFLNYDHVIGSLRMINRADDLNIGARHITISTCGIIAGIDKLAKEQEQFTLAISLHSAIQETRDLLMPRVANQPLPLLKESLKHYLDHGGRRVSFEYLLMDGVNDSLEHLEALISFCRGLLCHVNLLPMNTVEGAEFQPSPLAVAQEWERTLVSNGIEVSMRTSRGSDIDGACGQLKNKIVSRETR